MIDLRQKVDQAGCFPQAWCALWPRRRQDCASRLGETGVCLHGGDLLPAAANS
jgi:hypothetical protein